jgi:hypothetical protein
LLLDGAADCDRWREARDIASTATEGQGFAQEAGAAAFIPVLFLPRGRPSQYKRLWRWAMFALIVPSDWDIGQSAQHRCGTAIQHRPHPSVLAWQDLLAGRLDRDL